MSVLTILAHAKINLDLRLGARRPDGFHPIDTLFVRTDVADQLTATPSADGNLSLEIEGDEGLSAGPDNLGLPGEELLGQRFEDVPHVRRCILRFIDQDVVNGGVELHHDPAGMPGADQPTQCCDQVIEIESIARLLPRFEGVMNSLGEGHQGERALEHVERAMVGFPLRMPLQQRLQLSHEIGRLLLLLG